jgi:hypothetical protein
LVLPVSSPAHAATHAGKGLEAFARMEIQKRLQELLEEEITEFFG